MYLHYLDQIQTRPTQVATQLNTGAGMSHSSTQWDAVAGLPHSLAVALTWKSFEYEIKNSSNAI